MTRKPDTPCSRCGKLLWTNPASSLPSDLRVCRPCRKQASAPYKPPLQVACAVCKESFATARSGYRRRTCSDRCADLLRARGQTCMDCSGLMPPAVNRKRCEPCAKAAANRGWAEKTRRRRALKNGASAEKYTLAEIAARDRYRCQLCGRKVNMALTCPNTMAPTVDHVVPIHEGGDDTRANVQLAHFRCNSSKGARGSQQLALVG